MKTMDNTQITNDRSWEKVIIKYNHPDLLRSVWQICNSVIPYLLFWYILYRSLAYSYWITLLICVPACGFLIRIFIIFHDCGHGSFFKSKKTNAIVGIICGLLAYTPFVTWHNQHRIHHSTAGNLDKRGIGDVWTMTVDEFQNANKWLRFFYRAFRNPLFMYTFGPVFVIIIKNRFTLKDMTKEERWNVYFTNLMICVMAVGISLLIGFKAFLLIQVPILLISHSMGLWLFYIQHQFDDVTWDRTSTWDYKNAALAGSSFLKLPRIFQWFTGNIGYHHVHHLSSKIPNYYLERCHNENDLFKEVKPIRLFSTFRALKLGLWDEVNHQMVRFREIAL
jgi:acyl-lipid omega-6 desaturase (Delta-12 desaturase)